MFQLHEIAFGLNVIGNPVRLLHSFEVGAKDFVSEAEKVYVRCVYRIYKYPSAFCVKVYVSIIAIQSILKCVMLYLARVWKRKNLDQE